MRVCPLMCASAMRRQSRSRGSDCRTLRFGRQLTTGRPNSVGMLRVLPVAAVRQYSGRYEVVIFQVIDLLPPTTRAAGQARMPTVARAAAAAWHALSASRGSAARSAPPRGPDAALMRQRVQARLLWPIEHEYLENVQAARPGPAGPLACVSPAAAARSFRRWPLTCSCAAGGRVRVCAAQAARLRVLPGAAAADGAVLVRPVRRLHVDLRRR